MRRAAVIGAGSWGTAVAVLLARGGLEVQLGARTAEQVGRADRGRREPPLPAGRAAAGVDRRAPGLGDRARRPRPDLPRDPLRARCRRRSGRSPTGSASRSAVLLLTKGLIAPQGQLPAEYVGERVRARAIACLGGPAHAREAVSGSAALVLGSADARPAGPARRGLRPRRPRLRALPRRHRGRDGGRGQERRRPRRRRRRAARPQRRRDRRRRDLARVHRATRSPAAPSSRPSPASPGSAT